MTSNSRLLPRTSHRVAVAVGVVATGMAAVTLTGMSVSMVAAAANRNGTDPADAMVIDAPAQPPVILPFPGAQTGELFGTKGPYWKVAHSGLDFAAAKGTPIQAVVSGRIASVSKHPAYGKLVRLVRADRVEIWFCHLSAVAVTPGQQVTQGQLLGLSGDTGNVSGPHLHVEVRTHRLPTDPSAFFFATPGVPAPLAPWVKPYWEKPIDGYSKVNKEHEYVPGPPVH